MDFQLKKVTENNKTFLVYSLQENDIVDRTSVNMLKNNGIEHILPLSFTQIDDEKYLRYDITSKITLEEVLKRPISKERLLAIYDGIFSGIINLSDYMIPVYTILFSTDMIFYDESAESVCLLSFPINADENKNIDFESFARFLANKVQLLSNDEYIVGKILNRLNQTENFSVPGFKEFIDSLKNTKAVPQKSFNNIDYSVPAPSPISTNAHSTHDYNQSNSTGVQNSQNSNSTRTSQATSVNPPSRPKKNTNSQYYQKTPMSGGMNIPGRQAHSINIPNNPSNSKSFNKQNTKTSNDNNSNLDEPEISLFYLLQHYNAENAALYKKQKEARKSGSSKNKKQKMNMPGQNHINNTVPQSPIINNAPVVNREPQKRNFGNTTVLNSPNQKKTTVLNGMSAIAEQPKKAIIARNRTGEKIEINKSFFKLGSSEDGDVDFVLRGNTSISRRHANIEYKNGQYYITDNQSTNGTYVNANRLNPGVSVPLNPGDFIRMADEDFRFEIV